MNNQTCLQNDSNRDDFGSKSFRLLVTVICIIGVIASIYIWSEFHYASTVNAKIQSPNQITVPATTTSPTTKINKVS